MMLSAMSHIAGADDNTDNGI